MPHDKMLAAHAAFRAAAGFQEGHGLVAPMMVAGIILVVFRFVCANTAAGPAIVTQTIQYVPLWLAPRSVGDLTAIQIAAGCLLLPLAAGRSLWLIVRDRTAIATGFAAADQVAEGFWLPSRQLLLITLTTASQSSSGVLNVLDPIIPSFVIVALLGIVARCAGTPGRRLQALGLTLRAEIWSRFGIIMAVYVVISLVANLLRAAH